ncbi:MAG: IclR family acetate operon transcriptional repressor [Paracoccaceae bacterium]|jgi:IclR family acetate operon transcriptional repressor
MPDPKTIPTGTRRARGRPRDWHDKTDQNTIKSLDRAIIVLQRLAELGGATLSALADDLDQSPATTYRVLTTFQGRGLVDFDGAAQIWSIGAGAYLIGAGFLRRTSLVDRARPILRALMASTGETANLGVEKNGEVLFVSQVETQSNIRAFFPPGSMSDMHASGIGKALLAFMPADRRAAVLTGRALTRYTANTLTDPKALQRDLSQARTRGYAVDVDEKTDGMRCIAAPVFDPFGETVAGLSISGPTSRIADADIARLGAKVTAAARQLSAALGARPTDV